MTSMMSAMPSTTSRPQCTAEVYPTRLRGTGSGLSAGSSKLGGLVGSVATVTGLMSMSTGMLRPAVLVSIPMAVAAMLVALRGIETRGRRLEELAGASAAAPAVSSRSALGLETRRGFLLWPRIFRICIR
jgi:hypothetical protein